MHGMNDLEAIARRYLHFAVNEAHGSSPSYEAWGRAVAADPRLLSRLAALPAAKQQPNLVFAALRWHGAEAGDTAALRHGLLGSWDTVRSTIMRRSTQTNEAARCAVLLPLLHRIGGPVALIELGAAAGLCLIPDRYNYAYSDGTVARSPSGSGDVTISCHVSGGSLRPGLTAPQVAWRAGIDLNPLDPADPDTTAWLETLIWPEHEHRRQLLTAALPLAAAERVRIRRGDLLTGLDDVLSKVPAECTPVVFHSATLAYLSADDRAAAAAAIAGSGARWISFEGRGVVPLSRSAPGPATPGTLFVAALDLVPLALASGHGDTMTLLDAGS